MSSLRQQHETPPFISFLVFHITSHSLNLTAAQQVSNYIALAFLSPPVWSMTSDNRRDGFSVLWRPWMGSTTCLHRLWPKHRLPLRPLTVQPPRAESRSFARSASGGCRIPQKASAAFLNVREIGRGEPSSQFHGPPGGLMSGSEGTFSQAASL